MDMVNEERKRGIFYSVGETATLLLELVAAYGLFYMTTYQFLDAGIASTIISVATIVGALVSIIVGYASDRSPKGKRPYVIKFIVPAVICFVAIFAPVNFEGIAQVLYYGVVVILFYALYNLFLVPFDALGGEVVTDYKTRTFVRTLCTVFIYVGVILADTLSTYMRSAMGSIGFSEKASWFIMVLILGVIALVTVIFAWAATKGTEKNEGGHEAEKINFVSEYISLLKIKMVKVLSLWTVVYYIINITLATMVLYYGIYVLGLSENIAATLFSVTVIISIAAAPLVTAVAAKVGKKACLNGALLLYALYIVYIMIKGPEGLIVVCSL